MYTAFLAFFDGSSAAKWIGLVVALLGVALLFTDLVMNIKKRNHTKMNIVAMVFLVLSLVCYILTQWVLTDLPTLFGFIWVVFLVAYFVCDVIMAVGIGRDNHRKKLGMDDSDEENANNADANDANFDKDAAVEHIDNADASVSEAVTEADYSQELSAERQTSDNVKKSARKRGKSKKNGAANAEDAEAVNMLEEHDSDGTGDPTE